MSNELKISDIEQYKIDAKKEFNVAADASLLLCSSNSISNDQCAEFDFYNIDSLQKIFGWYENKFVSDVEKYKIVKASDGLS